MLRVFTWVSETLIFILPLKKKTKYLKIGHNMEPSRCKTTSTVTLACKFLPQQEATSKVSVSTIFQTQYMTYRWKDKILTFSHTKTHVNFSTIHAVGLREQEVCVQIKIFFSLFFFCKAEAVIIVDGPRSSTTIPAARSSVKFSSATTWAWVWRLRLERGKT